MKACHGLVPVFDEPNLVSAACLVPVLQLGERAGLSRLVDEDSSQPMVDLRPAAPVRGSGLSVG